MQLTSFFLACVNAFRLSLCYGISNKLVHELRGRIHGHLYNSAHVYTESSINACHIKYLYFPSVEFHIASITVARVAFKYAIIKTSSDRSFVIHSIIGIQCIQLYSNYKTIQCRCIKSVADCISGMLHSIN